MKGFVTDVRPLVRNARLRVVARIRTEECGPVEGYLPDREVSAFLPRCVLIGSARDAPREILGTVAPILSRLVRGRTVRLWKFGEEIYFSFLPWRAVSFRTEPESTSSTSGSRRPRRR